MGQLNAGGPAGAPGGGAGAPIGVARSGAEVGGAKKLPHGDGGA
jgi:hypothetical protein